MRVVAQLGKVLGELGVGYALLRFLPVLPVRSGAVLAE